MRRSRFIFTLLAVALLPAPGLDAADPLDSIPASSQVVLVAENPRKLAEAITGLEAFQKAQKLPLLRDIYDSTTAQRAYQLLAFVESELGAKWPELLDQLGGNGVAAALEFGTDPAPALLVLSGTDEKQVTRAMALAVQVLDEEYARQGAKERVNWSKLKSVDIAAIGSDLHFARIGATVLLSNKLEKLKAAIEQTQASQDRPQTHPARTDLAKVLPKGALASLWLNMTAVKATQEAKDFFAGTRGDFLQTLVLGCTIDCLSRADFVAAGLYAEPTGFRLRVRVPAGRDGLWDDLALHVPPVGQPGSLPPLAPPGTIASHSFHLDAGYMWKHRDRMITGDTLRDLEKAEKDVSRIVPGSAKIGELLEMWGPYHRIVVVNHDVRPYKKEPALKLPAFGYVATARDKRFLTSIQTTLSAAGVLGVLQFGMKAAEHDVDGITLTAYRFPENKELPEDPDGLRFNFEPCFAVVGDEVVMASTVELGKKLIAELKKPRPARANTKPIIQSKLYVAAGAAVLGEFADPLITDVVLGRGVGLAEARKEIAQLVGFIQTLGTIQGELEITAKEYRVDLVWSLFDR